ncbi:dipeptide epimerase [Xanthomonas hyacinthi]|uniref:Dipeptide epimerase n=1 Tax=Xanthomonas hyacinthi TaxID=56455 RepID=A0A2S7EX55_9XANT|nr:dipeptide epimerase [Xanthomonas hyacinthi]KLD80012.1 mandelate racemase [Xanthomonas hyacinthi DSM 19077]PPU97740.1 dipeptide epimerase [Xanthomonas hyacinthi]QGY77067.1 dipeptide epimerase [Xanthomonas hyacinthi]
MKLSVRVERWEMTEPFRISGQTFTHAELVVVELEAEGARGRGEACGVYYRGDDAAGMLRQLSEMKAEIEAGIDRAALQRRLPACGARNALDAALWELEAARAGVPVWRLAGLERADPLPTVFTIGIDAAPRMADKAVAMRHARAIKLKLSGDADDRVRVQAVRAARPDAWIGVDGNRGFTPQSLEAIMPTLRACQVQLIEQPFAIGRDRDLAGVDRAIPIAADESVQDCGDLEALVGLVDIVNIKLDKCGGLTHALAMERQARRLGFGVMVGNMTGTSWSQAPAFVLGQRCDLRDLDGPTFLARDRPRAVTYVDGLIHCPDEVWGTATAANAYG